MKVTEIASGIAHDGRTKADRYEWDALTKRCKHMRIKITELNVGDYQRGEATRASTVQKAKHWSHAAAGAIIVGQRKSGSFWIVDGLQRTLSECLRGDIDTVDCMVFESDGPEHEARVFQLCNLGRIQVTAIHKFRVAVRAGDQPEIEIERWVQDNGMKMATDKGRNQIGFPSVVVHLWPFNPEMAKRALLFAKRMGNGEICSELFKGAWWLLLRGVSVENHEHRIMKRGGSAVLLREINTRAIEMGGTKTPQACGQGILVAINYRRKNKIKVNQ